MKKKIIAILTAPLQRLYLFRIDRLFLLPSECRRLMEAHSVMVQKEFKYRREAFIGAVLELVQIRSKRTSTQYEVKIFVNRAALETKAGEHAAVADISLAIAKQLVERHHKTKAAEEERKNPSIKNPLDEIEMDRKDAVITKHFRNRNEALKCISSYPAGSIIEYQWSKEKVFKLKVRNAETDGLRNGFLIVKIYCDSPIQE